MIFILFIYFILYVVFLFGLFPLNTLFYIIPLSIIILTVIFYSAFKFLKKIYLKIFIFVINIGFCLILKEYGRISSSITIILITITSIILFLYFTKKRVCIIISSCILSIILIFLSWNGNRFIYKSRLTRDESINKISFFEYGENTNIKTYSIDSSKYYNGNQGLPGWYDEQYWGFSTELPLNGRVYYPEESGLYPIIFVVHGNALAENPSQLGYDYLLKHFAKNGFIAVSIDENFLNGNWTTLGKGQPKENDARGKLILEHINLFNNWNNDKDSKLYNIIDIENIGLVGHSRGGEAISIAAKYSDFPIKALMSLSGTDGQYRENINLKDISYIAIHGSNDGDVKSFKAKSQFNRLDFTNDIFNLKATYYIDGLNHVQFNTEWGEIDSTSLGKLFYGKNRNVKAEDQREIAKMLGLKLFNLKLKKNASETKYLKQPQLIDTLPDVSYITDYVDSETKQFTDNLMTENIDIKYSSLKNNLKYEIKYNKNNKIILRNNDLGKPINTIMMSLANKDLFAHSVTMKFFKDNIIVSQEDLILNPGLKKRRFKTAFLMENKTIEPNFQFFEIQLRNIKDWDTLELSLKNNRTKEGTVLFRGFSYTTSN